ncbi:MAG: alpha/beta hydrolase [Deltaproteobacteria bacterium]|nr:alpha/beta hydrolase [Deltaproteobacteria bacterium]MBW2069803.1 alpha/beta hydrolase [Deltaproteobacteria bacterium]
MPTIDISGSVIHYVTGPSGLAPGRRNFIFVHGAGGNSLVWQKQRYGLDRGVNTICPDLPGHGRSSGNGLTSIAEYSAWLSHFAGSLAQDKVVLVGHSMGGAVVLETALSRPQWLEAIVLIGTGARLKVRSDLLRDLEQDFSRAASKIVRSCYSEHAPRELRQWALEQLLAERAEVVADDFRACNAFDLMDDLPRIPHPALVICGSNDVMTPVKYSHYLADKLPRAAIAIIQDTGHMAMLEKGAQVNSAIVRFLSHL